MIASVSRWFLGFAGEFLAVDFHCLGAFEDRANCRFFAGKLRVSGCGEADESAIDVP
jgi:hypothetical protein